MLITAALVIAGCVAVYLRLQRMLKRTCVQLRREFQAQIDSLSAGVRALERRAVTQPAAAPASALASPGKVEPLVASAVAPIAAQAPATATQAAEEVTPEVLTAITETVTALLGKKVHIRSVKILRRLNAKVSPWAQQGRVVVQASHNLAQRSRKP
jgi:hypothetical protein